MHGADELVGQGGAAATPAAPTGRQLVHLGSAELQGAVDPYTQPLCLHENREELPRVCAPGVDGRHSRSQRELSVLKTAMQCAVRHS